MGLARSANRLRTILAFLVFVRARTGDRSIVVRHARDEGGLEGCAEQPRRHADGCRLGGLLPVVERDGPDVCKDEPGVGNVSPAAATAFAVGWAAALRELSVVSGDSVDWSPT